MLASEDFISDPTAFNASSTSRLGTTAIVIAAAAGPVPLTRMGRLRCRQFRLNHEVSWDMSKKVRYYTESTVFLRITQELTLLPS